MSKRFFITGTDTEVGKTWTTVLLMQYWRKQGFSVAGMKPVAAGCQWLDEQWKNEDALLIQQHNSQQWPYEWVNPYAFELAVSPHLAGQGVAVESDLIKTRLNEMQQQADVVVVEGAGGWLSPISSQMSNAELAIELSLPVILVVAIRLGCINQALLSFQSIQALSGACVGWIAVNYDAKMQYSESNIDYIKQHISAPLLGVIPHLKHPQLMEDDFPFSQLLVS